MCVFRDNMHVRDNVRVRANMRVRDNVRVRDNMCVCGTSAKCIPQRVPRSWHSMLSHSPMPKSM